MVTVSAQFAKNLQRFRLVTFDVTDTLLRLKDPAIQYVATASEYGLANLDKKRMQVCFRQKFKQLDQMYPNFGRHTPGMSWQQWWCQLVTDVFLCVDQGVSLAQVKQISKQLLHVYRTSACWTHVEQGMEFVQAVRKAGKLVGVISNFDPSLVTILTEMGLSDQFDFVLTSYEAGVSKPNSQIFSIPIGKLQISAAQALHIGNKYTVDYLGARNSGWSSLLVHQSDNKLDTNTKQTLEASTHAYSSLADMLKALSTKNIVW